MTVGSVRPTGEPIVPVVLHGRSPHAISAVLDTGFTGHLCLARRHRSRMRLVRVGDVETELADGRRVQQPAFLGEVTFHGRRMAVLVTTTSSHDTLLGTALLAGTRVEIDFVTKRVDVRRSQARSRR